MKPVCCLFLVSGLLVPLSVLADCSFHPESYRARDQWQTKLDAGQYDEVETHFSQVQHDFEDGRIDEFQLKADLASFEASAQQPDSSYDGWVARFPNSYVARLARGSHLAEVGDAQRGCEYAAKTSSQQFADFYHYSALARIDFDASLKLDAKPFFSYLKLISHDGFSIAELSLGTAMLRAAAAKVARTAPAGDWYQDTLFMLATSIVPNSYFARRALMNTLQTRWGGSTAQMQSVYDEAVSSGLPQVQLAALHSLVLRDEAWVLEGADDHAGAAASYKAAIEALNPAANTSLTGYYADEVQQLGWADEQLRNYPEAVYWLEKAYAMSPSDPWLISNLAFSVQKAGDLDRAATLYRQAADMEDPNSVNEWGKCQWWGMGVPVDRPGAILTFQKAVDLGVEEAKKNLYWSKKQMAEGVYYAMPK